MSSLDAAAALKGEAGRVAAADPTRWKGAPGAPPRVHAIPVGAGAPTDHWLIEGAYRLFEILVTLVALVFAVPVMLIEAAIIRLDSPGQALFRQPRMAMSRQVRGRDLAHYPEVQVEGPIDPDGLYYVPRMFKFMKFRTMYADARQRFPELYAYKFDPKDFHRLHFKHEDDPRVTRVGRTLRRLTIDELPNLWCVLIGEMRLVGPRPEIPEVVPYYSPEEMRKFTVRPGITGLAQIGGRGLLTWGQTLECDLAYVNSRSVWLDIKILFKTLWLVLTRHGAF